MLFRSASQNLVNSFQTDDKGLPKFADFNSKNLNTPDDLLQNNVDPRLNHSVAIPGLPYKYNPEFIFEAWWNRQPEVYGAFMSLKEVVLPDCPCFEKVKLMVPKGSLDAYRKSPWGKFRHIEEYE